MTWWRLRAPGLFPLEFHRAMQSGVGVDKVVTTRLTHINVLDDQKQFRLFRYCLRNVPHPTSPHELNFKHRTRVARNKITGDWQLLLTTREKDFADLEKIE